MRKMPVGQKAQIEFMPFNCDLALTSEINNSRAVTYRFDLSFWQEYTVCIPYDHRDTKKAKDLMVQSLSVAIYGDLLKHISRLRVLAHENYNQEMIKITNEIEDICLGRGDDE